MKRRANGEGSFYKLPDGRWAAEALITRPDGSSVKIKREAKTRALAAEKLDKARRAIAGGADGSGKLPTIADHIEGWYRDTFSPGAKPNSLRTYRSIIDKQIVPYVGKVRLDRLVRTVLRKWLADLARKEYAASTIALARAVLRQALDQAVDDGLIPFNPITRKISGPQVKASGGKVLTPEQARALLTAARGERLELAIRLALCLGLRRGEVCGLRWEDIDFEASTLTVRGQMIYVKDVGPVWVAPKSLSAIRTIKLPAVLLSAVRWHQTRSETESRLMGWEASPYVFRAATDGDLINPSTLYDAFQRAAEKAELKDFRLHDLRHSAASFLLAEGVSLKRVQQILGHARGSTTLNTYAHLIPGDDDDATDRIQNRINEDDEDDEDAVAAQG